MDTFDVIDVVVNLAIAGVAAVLAGGLFRRSGRGGPTVVFGRALLHPRLWAWALSLLAVALVLRTGIDVVPSAWQVAVTVATALAAAALIATLIMGFVRSRRP